jgi:hypothetical protein
MPQVVVDERQQGVPSNSPPPYYPHSPDPRSLTVHVLYDEPGEIRVDIRPAERIAPALDQQTLTVTHQVNLGPANHGSGRYFEQREDGHSPNIRSVRPPQISVQTTSWLHPASHPSIQEHAALLAGGNGGRTNYKSFPTGPTQWPYSDNTYDAVETGRATSFSSAAHDIAVVSRNTRATIIPSQQEATGDRLSIIFGCVVTASAILYVWFNWPEIIYLILFLILCMAR